MIACVAFIIGNIFVDVVDDGLKLDEREDTMKPTKAHDDRVALGSRNNSSVAETISEKRYQDFRGGRFVNRPNETDRNSGSKIERG